MYHCGGRLVWVFLLSLLVLTARPASRTSSRISVGSMCFHIAGVVVDNNTSMKLTAIEQERIGQDISL